MVEVSTGSPLSRGRAERDSNSAIAVERLRGFVWTSRGGARLAERAVARNDPLRLFGRLAVAQGLRALGVPLLVDLRLLSAHGVNLAVTLLSVLLRLGACGCDRRILTRTG